MNTAAITCSGLGWQSPCAKRDQCANFKHWTTHRSSEFNACAPSGEGFKFFAGTGAAVPVVPAARNQQELFA